MKNKILLIISVCCITAAFISCENKDDCSSPDTNKDKVEVVTSVTGTEPKKTIVTETEKAVVTEQASTTVQSLISDETINSYRNDKGIIYKDVNSMICANLTLDDNGYHLAINNGTEYVPDQAVHFVSFDDFGEVKTSVLAQNGSQQESDVYSIHGCFECLCLDVTDPAGTQIYKYCLYPADNFTDDTSPNKNLTEFIYTLDNFEWKDQLYNQEMPDFLNDDQKELFVNAEYVIRNFHFEPKYSGNGGMILYNNTPFDQTGMSYESFIRYTESVFTPQFSAAVHNQTLRYINVRGEMCASMAGRGGNIHYFSRSFKLTSQTDNEIKFKLISHCVDADILTEEEYNNLPSEKKYDEEYTFTMVKTPDGWRFSEFNYWL